MKYLLILLSSGLFIFCDALSANWGKTNSLKSIFIMIPLAPMTYLLFGLLNKKMSLGASSALVNIIIILGGVLISLLYFQEQLTIAQYIGIGLAFLAIIFLTLV